MYRSKCYSSVWSHRIEQHAPASHFSQVSKAMTRKAFTYVNSFNFLNAPMKYVFNHFHFIEEKIEAQSC